MTKPKEAEEHEIAMNRSPMIPTEGQLKQRMNEKKEKRGGRGNSDMTSKEPYFAACHRKPQQPCRMVSFTLRRL